jgi:hypothetical protein
MPESSYIRGDETDAYKLREGLGLAQIRLTVEQIPGGGGIGPFRWKAGDNAHRGATPLTSQPQTNPKYQFVNALYSSLALFETTNRVLQLVETTLLASLITRRSLIQIPQQPQHA